MSTHRSPLLRKLRLSVSTAIVAISVMVSLMLEENVPMLMDRRAEILGAALVLGILLWIAGGFIQMAKDDEESPFRFLRDPRYGAVMTCVTGLLFFFTTHDRPKPVQKAEPVPVKTEIVPRIPRAFPALNLQGIAFRSGASQVLIDRRLFEAGDTMDNGVQVLAIDREAVTLTFDGQTNVLRLIPSSRSAIHPVSQIMGVAGR